MEQRSKKDLKFRKVLLVLTLEKVLTDYSATTNINGTNRI